MALNLAYSPEGTCGQDHFDGALDLSPESF